MHVTEQKRHLPAHVPLNQLLNLNVYTLIYYLFCFFLIPFQTYYNYINCVSRKCVIKVIYIYFIEMKMIELLNGRKIRKIYIHTTLSKEDLSREGKILQKCYKKKKKKKKREWRSNNETAAKKVNPCMHACTNIQRKMDK